MIVSWPISSTCKTRLHARSSAFKGGSHRGQIRKARQSYHQQHGGPASGILKGRALLYTGEVRGSCRRGRAFRRRSIWTLATRKRGQGLPMRVRSSVTTATAIPERRCRRRSKPQSARSPPTRRRQRLIPRSPWQFSCGNGTLRRRNTSFEALTLNPCYHPARGVWYGLFFLQSTVGRTEEGLSEVRRALEADPLSSYTSTCLSMALAQVHQWQEAVRWARIAVEQDPESFLSRFQLGNAYHWNGRCIRMPSRSTSRSGLGLVTTGLPWRLSRRM